MTLSGVQRHGTEADFERGAEAWYPVGGMEQSMKLKGFLSVENNFCIILQINNNYVKFTSLDLSGGLTP
jgi:hypothetical protein